MPYFTLHRSYTLRTTKGHSISFIKGEPTWVPPTCVPDAVAIGAVSDEHVDVIEKDEKPAVYFDPMEREKKLLEAFDAMVARNDRDDYTAAGLPHCKRLERLVGFEVSITERDTAWQKYNAKGE